MWGTQVFIPDSIFAKERFVMWKKPSLMRRNMWYIPANNKHNMKKKPKNKQANINLTWQLEHCFYIHLYIYITLLISPEDALSSSIMR